MAPQLQQLQGPKGPSHPSQNLEVLHSGTLCPEISAFIVNNQGPGKGNGPTEPVL